MYYYFATTGYLNTRNKITLKTHGLFRKKRSYAFKQEKTKGGAFRNRLISLPVLFYRRSRLPFLLSFPVIFRPYSALANSCPLQTNQFLFPLIYSHHFRLASNKF